MDQETDHRLGVVELKQTLRDARCAKCHDEMRKEFKIARHVRWLAVMAVVLAMICVVLVAVD